MLKNKKEKKKHFKIHTSRVKSLVYFVKWYDVSLFTLQAKQSLRMKTQISTYSNTFEFTA